MMLYNTLFYLVLVFRVEYFFNVLNILGMCKFPYVTGPATRVARIIKSAFYKIPYRQTYLPNVFVKKT